MDVKTYGLLSEIAQGKRKAALVIKNAKVLDVYNEVWLDEDVAIQDGKVIAVGKYEGEVEIDYKGKYIVPGFIDSHLHLESTLVNPKELAFEAAKWGTVSLVVDPHEAANVAGLDGIQFILDETEDIASHVYVMAPSCVPAVPGEENGALLDAKTLAPLLTHPRLLGLGEVMDCYSVINADPMMMAKLETFADRPKDGHIIGLSEQQLAAYALAGITTNHEATNYAEAKNDIKNGMYVFIREGSGAHNLEDIVKGLVADGASTNHYGFCTDDKHIEDIQAQGHISYNVKKAIEYGISPIKAFKMASTNAAQCYGFKTSGAIAPGYNADFVVLDDIHTVAIHDVYIGGKPVDKTLEAVKKPVNPKLLNTINIGDFSAKRLELAVTEKPEAIINLVPGQLLTLKSEEIVPKENGFFKANAEYNKITCIERYKATGHNGVGILKGFNLHDGAIATSFAHDAHNVIVVGDNDADMVLAVERLTEIGGGYVITSKGKVVEELQLEIMGLMTNTPHSEVDAKVAKMKAIAYKMGVPETLDPFINLSFLALTVIPQIRVTTKGVVLV